MLLLALRACCISQSIMVCPLWLEPENFKFAGAVAGAALHKSRRKRACWRAQGLLVGWLVPGRICFIYQLKQCRLSGQTTVFQSLVVVNFDLKPDGSFCFFKNFILLSVFIYYLHVCICMSSQRSEGSLLGFILSFHLCVLPGGGIQVTCCTSYQPRFCSFRLSAFLRHLMLHVKEQKAFIWPSEPVRTGFLSCSASSGLVNCGYCLTLVCCL